MNRRAWRCGIVVATAATFFVPACFAAEKVEPEIPSPYLNTLEKARTRLSARAEEVLAQNQSERRAARAASETVEEASRLLDAGRYEEALAKLRDAAGADPAALKLADEAFRALEGLRRAELESEELTKTSGVRAPAALIEILRRSIEKLSNETAARWRDAGGKLTEAADTKDMVRRFYEEGLARYDEGDFEGAIRSWRLIGEYVSDGERLSALLDKFEIAVNQARKPAVPETYDEIERLMVEYGVMTPTQIDRRKKKRE